MEFAELQYHYLDFLSTLKKEKKNVLTLPKNKLFRRNFSSFFFTWSRYIILLISATANTTLKGNYY